MPKHLHYLKSTCRFFGSDRKGSIIPIFALSILPVMSFMGCAIDYSQTSNAYSKLAGCADAATLGAVSLTGMTMSAANAIPAMQDWFNTQCAGTLPKMSNVTLSSVAATAVDKNGIRTATLSFTGSRKNDFLGVAGFPTTNIKGGATAMSALPTYIDLYALLDDSPSMGLAATTADQTKLKSLTGGCEFACHVSGWYSDNYKTARANNVQLRIDVLRNAWVNMIAKSSVASSIYNNFRYATYTFDRSLNLQQSLTGSSADALTTANAIDLMVVDSSGPGSTYADSALQSIVSKVPAAGDGSSPAKSKKYLIFVTDGVQDYQNGWAPYGHQTLPLTASNCDALKNKGIQVSVIYTTYLKMSEDTYNTLVRPFENQIGPALKSCASPDLYFEASQAADIDDAFGAIFNKVLVVARLSQ